jgi:hypothetical protein
MLKRILGLVGTSVACAALAQTPTQLALLSVSVDAYPSHGLPAVPPAIRVRITNGSNAALTVPSVGLCLQATRADGSSFGVGCDSAGYLGDWNSDPFDVESPGGPFVLKPGETRVLFVTPDRNIYFQRSALLEPGPYDIRFRLGVGDIPSNVIRYNVDAPQGDNQTVWSAIKTEAATDPPLVLLYFNVRLYPTFSAHPGSDYAKVWGYFRDLSVPVPAAARLQRLQGYVATRLPEPFDILIRSEVAIAYQHLAEETALAGHMDDAAQQAAQGRAILDALRGSNNPYADGLAAKYLHFGPWNREQLRDYVDAHTPRRMKPIEPKVNCVLKNPDQSYTAWFGYVNPNSGIYLIPAGSENTISPAPAAPSVPTVFQIGSQRRVFSLSLQRGQKVTWLLVGKSAVAEAGDESGNCDKEDD